LGKKNLKMTSYKIDNIDLASYDEHTTLHSLNNYETLDYKIKRIFFVNSKLFQIRGNHAHKKCIQSLICISGSIEVTLDNLKNKKTIILNSPKECLTIYPNTWSSQTYQTNSTLMVLCSEPYDESDYIRDYNQYIKLNKK